MKFSGLLKSREIWSRIEIKADTFRVLAFIFAWISNFFFEKYDRTGRRVCVACHDWSISA